MELFLQWALLASVQLAATMSPGPAFVVSVRNSMAHSRSVGVFTSLGLALGVGAHVVFVLVGISLVISQSVILFSIVKYAGAAYLCYVGIKAIFFSKKRGEEQPLGEVDQNISPAKKAMSTRQAIMNGFLTNLLNPKAVVFFTAVYTQFIGVDTPLSIHLLYGVTSIVIEFLWFAGVAIVLTNPRVKRKFMSVMHWVERSCGGLMVALGVKLALSK